MTAQTLPAAHIVLTNPHAKYAYRRPQVPAAAQTVNDHLIFTKASLEIVIRILNRQAKASILSKFTQPHIAYSTQAQLTHRKYCPKNPYKIGKIISSHPCENAYEITALIVQGSTAIALTGQIVYDNHWAWSSLDLL